MVDDGSLLVPSATKEDQGRYQCQAANLAATRETRPVRLRVLGEIHSFQIDYMLVFGLLRHCLPFIPRAGEGAITSLFCPPKNPSWDGFLAPPEKGQKSVVGDNLVIREAFLTRLHCGLGLSIIKEEAG